MTNILSDQLRDEADTLGEGSAAEAAGAAPDGDSPSRHRLSLTTAGSGPEDLAEHAEEYLRASGFGYPSG
jgi:hypothetical protein